MSKSLGTFSRLTVFGVARSAAVMNGITLVALFASASVTVSAQEISNVCVTVLTPSPAGVVAGSVTAGTTYSYAASACIHHNLDPGCSHNNPNGQGFSGPGCTDLCLNVPTIANNGFVCPGLAAYSLVGRVGGTCIQMGNTGTFTAPASGSLNLVFNDDIFGDNNGSINVCIAAGSVLFTKFPPPIIPLACGAGIPTPEPTHSICVTRSARFWMEHPIGEDLNCVSLMKALTSNQNGIDLGFVCLPTTYRNADNVADAADATIEALGLQWRSGSRTGEDDGTQNRKLRGAKLCKDRKKLAVEFVAATANVVLLGTDPGNCQYEQGGEAFIFPSDLLQQAGAVASGEDVTAIRSMTALLRKFNGLGQTNAFPGELVECSPVTRKSLRSLSRDPTTASTCPGVNDTCTAARNISSFPYTSSAKLNTMTDAFPSPSCGAGGADAIWKITPRVAVPQRNFVVRTAGSTFQTLVSVWRGSSCDDVELVGCSAQTSDGSATSYLQFEADGTSTYFIVVEGVNGTIGKLELKVTSF